AAGLGTGFTHAPELEAIQSTPPAAAWATAARKRSPSIPLACADTLVRRPSSRPPIANNAAKPQGFGGRTSRGIGTRQLHGGPHNSSSASHPVSVRPLTLTTAASPGVIRSLSGCNHFQCGYWRPAAVLRLRERRE